MTKQMSKHALVKLLAVGAVMLSAVSCKEPLSALNESQKNDKIDRPIDDTPATPVSAVAAGDFEYLVYYANETDLDEEAKANRKQVVDAIDALLGMVDVPEGDKTVLRLQKEKITSDEATFKKAVDDDFGQLLMKMCRDQGNLALAGPQGVAVPKRGLFYFSNRKFKAGTYGSCVDNAAFTDKPIPGKAQIDQAIAQEADGFRQTYLNSPNAYKMTFEKALAIVANAVRSSDRVVLITKSHGNKDNALVPPMQKAYSSEWFKKYLEGIGASEAANHATDALGSGVDGQGPLGSGNDGSGALGSGHNGSGALGLIGSGNEQTGKLGEGVGLGESEASLGGIGAGLKKSEYVDVINASKVPLSMVFLEACNTTLPQDLVAKLQSARAAIKVWASDSEGLIYRTVTDYDAFDFGRGSFAQNLDERLKKAAADPNYGK